MRIMRGMTTNPIPRILLAGMAALALAAACEVLPPPAQNATAPWANVTDSIGFQYAIAGGSDQWPTARWNSALGASIDACPYQPCTPPDDYMAAATAAGTLPRVFIELGPNDAYNGGGWNADDEAKWTAALTALPPGTCAVVALPYVAPVAYPTDPAQIAKARTWLAWAADTLPTVHAIDWGTYATRPGVLGPDGLHLAPADPGADLGAVGDFPITAAALDAYHDLVADAQALCP